MVIDSDGVLYVSAFANIPNLDMEKIDILKCCVSRCSARSSGVDSTQNEQKSPRFSAQNIQLLQSTAT